MTTPRRLLLFAVVAPAVLFAARVSAGRPEPGSYANHVDPAYDSAYVDEPDYDREFSLGVGYARINFSDPGHELDALHFNPVFSFAPLEGLSPLRLGAGLGLSFSLENITGAVGSGDGGLVAVGDSDTSLILFQPELNLSWRQPLGDEDVGFFLEPGAAAGGTFAFFDVDEQAFESAGGTGDPDEWASTFHAKAFLRAGLRVTGGIAGLEAAYLRGGDLDLGNTGDQDLETFYVGFFGALKF